MLKYPAKLHGSEKSGFWISFPDFSGSGTQGATLEEVFAMGEDLLGGVLGVFYEENRTIPEPSKLPGKNIVYIEVPPEVAIPILVRRRRNELHLSQGEVAERIKAPYQTIQKLEKIGSNPTIKTLKRVAKALGKRVMVDLA